MKDDMNEGKLPLIVIVGPTAVGKTEISLQLAERFRGEIISADSRLFYQGMDIGTAKPSQEELTRIRHHLIDVSPPDERWSLAIYLQEVHRIIHDISQRDKLPFLVGGTGQYIRAVVEGWNIPTVQPKPGLRQAIKRWADQVGVDGIRERLNVLDPEAAEIIDGPNLRRMIRALEVIFSSGKLFSAQRGKKGSPYEIFQLGLIRPRQELYDRIDQRLDSMLERGLVDEVKDLLSAGYSADLPSLSAIGYKQIIHHLQGRISLEEAVRQIRSKSRKYVRQQANWFQAEDPGITWVNPAEVPLSEITQEIQHFLDRIG